MPTYFTIKGQNTSSSHYLENDYSPIICLEVKCPGWGDEAVSLVHHVFTETPHQSQRVKEMDSGHHGQQLPTKTNKHAVSSNSTLVKFKWNRRLKDSKHVKQVFKCFTTPAPFFALQMAADSGILDCMRTAPLTECRLHDRLQGSQTHGYQHKDKRMLYGLRQNILYYLTRIQLWFRWDPCCHPQTDRWRRDDILSDKRTALPPNHKTNRPNQETRPIPRSSVIVVTLQRTSY